MWSWNCSLRYCMNTLLTTTALLNMHIHSLPAGGAFGPVSPVTAEHKAAQHRTLNPLEIIIKIFLYNLRLYYLKFDTSKFKTF